MEPTNLPNDGVTVLDGTQEPLQTERESAADEEMAADGPKTADNGEREDPLAELRGALEELRALVSGLAERNGQGSELTDEFRALYPDVRREQLPDEVWEATRGGLPLEAAYALYERRQALLRKDAERVNRRNADGGWGRADAATEGFLSPDEVRAMSPTEVRKHYARIVESMKHWD